MGSDRVNRENVIHTGDSGNNLSDKQNIVSLKTAIAVQARLVAELRDEVDRLKAPKQDRAKSHSIR